MVSIDEEIAGLEEGEESKSSEALWKDARKHKHEAISQKGYCGKGGIEI